MVSLKKLLCFIVLSFVVAFSLHAQVLDDETSFEGDVSFAPAEPYSEEQLKEPSQPDLTKFDNLQNTGQVASDAEKKLVIYNQSDVRTNDNGILVDVNNNPVTGEVRDYYPNNGRVLTKTIYENGVKNGYHRIYFQDGTYMSETNYVNGKEEGVASVFYPNGEDRLSITFKQGEAISGYCVNSQGKRIDMTTAELRKFLDEYVTPCEKF